MDIRSVSGFLANRPASASAASTAQTVADAAAETPETSASKTQPASAASASDPVVVAGGYISPVLRYDQSARLAVIHFRDRSSGETQNQIPAEQVVEQYRRTASRVGVPTDRAAEGDGTASFGHATPGAPSTAGTSYTAAATGTSTAGVGMPGAASAAGSYGTGSPGALVSVTA